MYTFGAASERGYSTEECTTGTNACVQRGAHRTPITDNGCTATPTCLRMPADFTSLHNYYELQVVQMVIDMAPRYPLLTEVQHPDVACVALNRLPPRYIRHQVDLVFHMTEKERTDNEQLVREAVVFAFEFVQARYAMRARR